MVHQWNISTAGKRKKQNVRKQKSRLNIKNKEREKEYNRKTYLLKKNTVAELEELNAALNQRLHKVQQRNDILEATLQEMQQEMNSNQQSSINESNEPDSPLSLLAQAAAQPEASIPSDRQACEEELNVNIPVALPAMTAGMFDTVMASEHLCKAWFGLTPNEIDNLYVDVEPCMLATTMHCTQRKNYYPTKKGWENKTHLLLCLLWLRQYPIVAVLEVLFSCDYSYIHKLLRRTLTAMEKALAQEISWPAEHKITDILTRHRHPKNLFPNAFCVVDGTEIRVHRSSSYAEQKYNFSSKKRQYSKNVLLLVTLDGIIIYVSPASSLVHDQALWNAEQVRKKFENIPYGLLGDGGFFFNPKKSSLPDIIGFTPI